MVRQLCALIFAVNACAGIAPGQDVPRSEKQSEAASPAPRRPGGGPLAPEFGWHWNWHVDADHADLNAAAELARHVAVAREAGHAIAKFMAVDQVNRRCEICHANA